MQFKHEAKIRSLKINQSAKVRTFNRVETLNLFVTRTKTYSNSDVVLTAHALSWWNPSYVDD